MTTHYNKTLEELTAEEVWTAAKMALVWSNGKSHIPGAYGLFSEADHYAYDAWRYLDYLAFHASGTPKSPEQWCEFHLKKYEEEGKPEYVAKTKLYIELLKEVVEKWRMKNETDGLGMGI